jgi:hypothetical protein
VLLGGLEATDSVTTTDGVTTDHGGIFVAAGVDCCFLYLIRFCVAPFGLQFLL